MMDQVIHCFENKTVHLLSCEGLMENLEEEKSVICFPMNKQKEVRI